MAKATLTAMDELHNSVANELKKGLDDPKMLAVAIRFLKDNNITVDLQESNEVQSLFSTISSLKTKPADSQRDKVELILEDYM